MMVALDGCFSALPCGGSPDLSVPRQDEHFVAVWEAIFELGSPSLGIGGFSLCQRNGSVAKQKARLSEADSEDFGPRESFSQATASVPQEASSGSGCCKGSIDEVHGEIGQVGEAVPDPLPASTGLHGDVAGARNDLFGKHISFASWCSQMVASVFRTRTAFSAFVRSAIHLSRDSAVSKSPAFPIPLPHCGVFGRMPSGLSLRQRSRIHFRRAVVITILALNFWWSGNRFIDLDLLRRSPSVSQRRIIRRAVDFMHVDGPKSPFDVSLAGRRSPQLIARLTELSAALTSAGVKSSPYDRTFDGVDPVVPVDNSLMPELEPYRSLDFERLRVVGEGHFDPVPYLEDNLCMAYCNPDCLFAFWPP